MLQSSRVARPQDASKALYLGHCLVAQLVLTWIRTSSVCFVLFRRLLTLKLRWARAVSTEIQFSSTSSDTTWVSFGIWIKLAPSILLKMLLNMLDFLCRQEGWCSEVHYRCACQHSTFLRPPAEPLLTDEGLCHVEFQEAAPQTSSFGVLLLPFLDDAFHSSSSCAVLASSASLAWCSRSSFSDLEFQNYVTRQIEPNQSKFRYFKVKWWLLLPSLEWVLLLLVFFFGW